jgi:phage/plasmid-like protein (TIGR03299 family)
LKEKIMAHELDMSNEQANVAMLKKGAWHSLGQILEPGQPIDIWAKAAGLSHSVERATVQYSASGILLPHTGKDVLYRSDTNAPLGVVGSDYNIVQPQAVLDFFAQLAANNHFELETAGSLSGGKRIWAMAKVNDGATIIGQDVVKPYVLLATSYDGTLATTARFTSVRVVCSNTLGYASTESGDTVRINHSKAFSPKDAALDLGIALNGFDKFLIQSRALAKKQVNNTFAVQFLKTLLPVTMSTKMVNGIKVQEQMPIEKTKAFQSIMSLFNGQALGNDLLEAEGTAWGLLNAVTEHVDHGLNQNAAWFGYGNTLKNKARDLLLEVTA